MYPIRTKAQTAEDVDVRKRDGKLKGALTLEGPEAGVPVQCEADTRTLFGGFATEWRGLQMRLAIYGYRP